MGVHGHHFCAEALAVHVRIAEAIREAFFQFLKNYVAADSLRRCV
jgi:hypothetical protein